MKDTTTKEKPVDKKLELETLLFSKEPKHKKGRKDKKSSKKVSKFKDSKKKLLEDKANHSSSSKNEKLEFIQIKKKKPKHITSMKRNSIIKFLNKINSDDKKDQKKEDTSEDDINNDDKNNLILYADQLHKLYELEDRDKNEDLIQKEKDIKEKYKQIIIKYTERIN